MTSHVLFVMPRARGGGFRASIRGHILDLVDPGADHVLAPTPDDLFVVSIASEYAWSAERLLRGSGLPVDVSVAATWRTHEDLAGPADIDLTLMVPRGAEALVGALENGLAARAHVDPVVHISLEGVDR